MTVSQRREMRKDIHRQSGSFELALAPVIFASAGYGLDRWLGLLPLLTIALFVLGVIGVFVKLWLGYDREMREHEENAPWAPQS